MSLDTLYPEAPQAIDMREPQKAQKQPFKVKLPKVEGAISMNVSQFEIFKKAISLYLMLAGFWATGWGAYSYVSPDSTVYKNLRGLPMQDRAYMKAFIDDCSMTNFFESKVDKCQVSSAALQTLIKGKAVVAKFDGSTWRMSPEPLPNSPVDGEIQPGNAESPAE